MVEATFELLGVVSHMPTDSPEGYTKHKPTRGQSPGGVISTPCERLAGDPKKRNPVVRRWSSGCSCGVDMRKSVGSEEDRGIGGDAGNRQR